MEDDLKNCYIVVPRYKLGTYTGESIPIDMHLVRATAAHFHEVTERPRPIVSSRERSMPLPPTEGAISCMHSRDDLGPIEEPRRSTIPAAILFPKEKRTRGRKGGEGNTLRPYTLQKFCKNFNGIGDPYDHVAQYRQLLFAEGITDVHSMVQAFGLTMEGQALAWFF